MYRSYLYAFFLLFITQSLISQDLFPDVGEVFRDDVIPRIDLSIEEDSIAALFDQANLESDHHYPADFIFDNGSVRDTFENVGIRLRGNTSRYSAKKSIKVSFNTFVDGGDYRGLEKLNLNGEHNDPSVIRSKLCWDLMRNCGVPAPRSNHIDLYVNGVFAGLYINVEHIDEEFVESRFGNKNGNLYKCLWPADLDYKGSSPDLYKSEAGGRRTYDLKTNTYVDDYSDLAEFINVLNNTPIDQLPCELDKILNTDVLLRVIAVDVLTANWDGPFFNKNNFYLYKNSNTGKFEYIPYDLDNTFGIDWFNVDWASRDIYNWGRKNEPRPLYYRFLSHPEYRNRLSYYIAEFLENIFNEEALFPYLNEIRSKMMNSVINDPFRPLDYGFTVQDFLNSFEYSFNYSHVKYGIKDYISTRSASAWDQLDNFSVSPIISDISALPDYENKQMLVFAKVLDDQGISEVSSCYAYANDIFTCYDLLDNGIFPDQTAGDNVFSGTFPLTDFSGEYRYYIEAKDLSSTYYRNPICDELVYNFGEASNNLKINELMASNNATIEDENGDYDDWFELYNNGQDSIFLGDKYLTDDRLNPTKWKMPNTYLRSGEYLLIWADEDQEDGELHCNFKLSKSGEFIGIYDRLGLDLVLLDGVDFATQQEDISMGRLPDGEGNFEFTVPTPGAPNQSLDSKDIYHDVINIFPNPGSGLYKIDFPYHRNLPSGFELFDSKGVKYPASHFYWANDHILLDISKLNKGLYFISLNIANKKVVRKLFFQ